MALSKLGNSFEIVAVVFPDPDCLADVWQDLPEEILSLLINSSSFKCSCCGSTRLLWPAVIKNEQGIHHIVGTKCASNMVKGIDPHEVSKLKHAAMRQQRDHFLASEEFTTWLKGMPHPKGWANNSRLDDVRHWVMRTLPKMAVIRKAWREFAKAKKSGLISPDGVQHSAEWKALASFHAENEAGLKAAPHHLSAKKRWAKKKTCADFVEWALDAKTTDADALSRALVIAKHSMGLGPSWDEIEAQKKAAAAEKAVQEKAELSAARKTLRKASREFARAITAKHIDPETGVISDSVMNDPLFGDVADVQDSIACAKNLTELAEAKIELAALVGESSA